MVIITRVTGVRKFLRGVGKILNAPGTVTSGDNPGIN